MHKVELNFIGGKIIVCEMDEGSFICFRNWFESDKKSLIIEIKGTNYGFIKESIKFVRFV